MMSTPQKTLQAAAPRRESSRALIIVGLVVVVVGGSVSLYINVDWAPYLPNSLLVKYTDLDDVRYRSEALKRFNDDKLSKKEIEHLLRASLGTPLIQASEVHPSDMPIQVTLTPRFQLPAYQRWMMAMRTELLVNGEVRREAVDGRAMNLSDAASQILLDFPSLEEGSHRLCVRWTGILHDKQLDGKPGEEVVRVTRDAEFTIRIRGRIEDYVECKTSTFLAESLRERTWLGLMYMPNNEDRALTASLITFDAPIAVASDIWVKPAKSRKYSFAGSFKGTSGIVYLKKIPNMKPGSTVDVILVPSSAAALRAGLTAYFGGTLEWKGIRLPPANSGRGDALPILYRYPVYDVRPDLKVADKLKQEKSI